MFVWYANNQIIINDDNVIKKIYLSSNVSSSVIDVLGSLTVDDIKNSLERGYYIKTSKDKIQYYHLNDTKTKNITENLYEKTSNSNSFEKSKQNVAMIHFDEILKNIKDKEFLSYFTNIKKPFFKISKYTKDSVSNTEQIDAFKIELNKKFQRYLQKIGSTCIMTSTFTSLNMELFIHQTLTQFQARHFHCCLLQIFVHHL